jgi:cytochrome c oxidase assembly protein subunit 15
VPGTAAGPVSVWLLACAFLIFLMVVIGGITRLTESGLSIVEWKPLGGAIPPLTEADWQETFRLYKESPQYRQVNAGMSLEDFKGIFWWEWIHRQWGRMLGFAFLIPLLVFWWRGMIGRELRLPLIGLFVLGGVQGAIGWWMVASGLKDVPWVSPYRLATHLGVALLILSLCLWIGLGLRAPRGPARVRGGFTLVALIALTVLAGAFVAGLDAGLIYNEFPRMGEGLIPADYRNPALGWLANAFENHAAVQFHHRVLASLTGLAALTYAVWGWQKVPEARPALAALAMTVCLQYTLGILTLLHHVPVSLGAAHQGGAVLLLSAALWVCHSVRRR